MRSEPAAPYAHADHYESLAQQARAARFGMWIFLATEVLLFGGLFVGYAFYRGLFPMAFKEASRHLDVALGTVETVVLITSSLAAVLALHFVRAGRRSLAVGALLFTMGLGLAFLVLHGMEYLHEFNEGIMPGAHYHFAELPLQGANLFFTLYFCMTGLHGAHVVAGISVLGWITVKTALGNVSAAHDTPVEVATLYWHLVDIIWIFLYPMLYLAG